MPATITHEYSVILPVTLDQVVELSAQLTRLEKNPDSETPPLTIGGPFTTRRYVDKL